ncbi:hypothetical protein QUF55_00535 [Clostridiaceae bacterium HSG29]|nr:hypothetical protein [Clostridiaceae bacterium HSG29]
MFELIISMAAVIFSIFIGIFIYKNILRRLLGKNEFRIDLIKKNQKKWYQMFGFWFILVLANYGAFVRFDNMIINILLPLAWILGLVMIIYMRFSPEYILGDSIYTSTGSYKLEYVDAFQFDGDEKIILHMRTANKIETWAYKNESYDVVINISSNDKSLIEAVLRNNN